MIVGEVERKVADYLHLADRLLPNHISGLYVVGSVALGEYVPGRSDLDFIAVLRRHVADSEMSRLRLLHLLAGGQSALKVLAGGRWPTVGTPNGVFVREGDLGRPVSQIRPVASHTGYRFARGTAFDVNPVVWKVLLERGLTFRGVEPTQLGLDCQPDILKQWNLDNLTGYWQAWGRKVSDGGHRFLSSQRGRYGGAWLVAWGVLGSPRLHCTMATGQVIGKRSAGEYALRKFDSEWHPVIKQGLAHRRGEPVTVTVQDIRRAGEFVLAVVEAAQSL